MANKIEVANNSVSAEQRAKFMARKEKRKIAKNLEIEDLNDVADILEKMIKRIVKLEKQLNNQSPT